MLFGSNRTAICSVVFLDVVGYSKLPDSRQVAAKAQFNEVVQKSLAPTPEAERVVLDTGDGAALCFLGDPEAAITAAGRLANHFGPNSDAELSLRTGINLGPVRMVTDVNLHQNVVGDAINVAQRIMSFAAEGEILVSRSYYEIVARLRDGNAALFRFRGSRRDKHGRVHKVYAIDPAAIAQVAPGPDDGGAAAPLGAATLQAIEQRVIERIGPIGRVIVARAVAVSTNLEGVLTAFAAGLPDDPGRDALLADLRAMSGPDDDDDTRGAGFDAADIAHAERRLAHYIGPLANVLARRAAREAVGKTDFLHRLADHIPDRAQRSAFLATFDV